MFCTASLRNAYISIQSHGIMKTSPLLTHDLLDICIFCKLLSL